MSIVSVLLKNQIKISFLFDRVSGAPESCVDSLLEASVKYTPHFDWVIAHIGYVKINYVQIFYANRSQQ